MNTLILELTDDVLLTLQQEAAKLGRSLPAVAQELLVERLAEVRRLRNSDRDEVRQVLRAGGLLADPTPIALATKPPRSELRAEMDRVGGTTLSEILLEQRGPKE